LSGFEASRRDDLESLAYTLIYFLRGLPWQGINGNSKKKQAEVLLMKISITPQVLCQGLPTEFETFLNHVRVLEFSQKPDYQYLRNLMRAVSERPLCDNQSLNYFFQDFPSTVVTDASPTSVDSSKSDEIDEIAAAWRCR
jgi:hypothetical protein